MIKREGGVHAVVQLSNYRDPASWLPPNVHEREFDYLQYDSDADTVCERCSTPELMPNISRKKILKMLKQKRKADRKTVLAYNLPMTIKRDELVAMFGPFGRIRNLTVPLDNKYQPIGFAYIEYKHKGSICNAILEKNFRVYRKKVLRVESKRNYLEKVAKKRARGKYCFDVTAQPYRYELH